MTAATRTALVTGGGRGIGKAIALAFARDGYNVAVLARNAEQVDATVTEARALGVEAVGTVCDVADRASLGKSIDETVARFGGLHVLVNNAGYACFKPFMELMPEEWQQTFDVNVTAVFHACQAAIPHMMRQGFGRIINISSVAGVKPLAKQSAYCASKHALQGLSKVLAMELRDHDIAVHTICPGGVDTELARTAMPERDKQGWMRPEDIAEVAVFLSKLSARATVDEVVIRRFGSVPIGG